MTARSTPNSTLADILAADLRFFRLWPMRRHRLRLAGRAEIDEARDVAGLIAPTDRDVRVFVGVRRLSPGLLHRVVGFAVDVGEVDFDEAAAASGYARLAPQDVTAPPVRAALWSAGRPLSQTGAPLE